MVTPKKKMTTCVHKVAQSIIKDADLNECSEHETKSLGNFGLFDLTRVRSLFSTSSLFPLSILNLTVRHLFLGLGEDVSPANQVRNSGGSGQALA